MPEIVKVTPLGSFFALGDLRWSRRSFNTHTLEDLYHIAGGTIISYLFLKMRSRLTSTNPKSIPPKRTAIANVGSLKFMVLTSSNTWQSSSAKDRLQYLDQRRSSKSLMLRTGQKPKPLPPSLLDPLAYPPRIHLQKVVGYWSYKTIISSPSKLLLGLFNLS